MASGAKKYNCIYCNYRDYKDNLCNHIGKKHLDEIPEGFTPLQVTFHIVNKHPLNWQKPCRVCQQPCDWDEKKGRYNLLCNNKICHEKWAEKMKKDMGDKMGSNRPTQSAEGLQKMLAARKISGKYTWSDGTVFTYVGSYEKATLEFMDTVLEIKSEDIMVPGPILEYDFEGKKHLYITDIYYIPYNLIIEVKDGGNNPNTNPEMYENRKKKIAKEKYVIEKTDYNYIRLTNKDFSQLMSVFADLKMSLVDKSNNRVIHVNESNINENMYPALAGALPPMSANCVYITNYMKNNAFVPKSNIAVSDSPRFDSLYTIVDGVLKKKKKDFLKECTYNTYFVDNCKDRVADFCDNNLDKEVSESSLYEAIFGHRLMIDNQIVYEDNAIEYQDVNYQEAKLSEFVINYFTKGE